MLCYKDKTFCTYYKQCLYGSSCNRALTPEVKANAMSLLLPISRFICIPDCFEEKGGIKSEKKEK